MIIKSFLTILFITLLFTGCNKEESVIEPVNSDIQSTTDVNNEIDNELLSHVSEENGSLAKHNTQYITGQITITKPGIYKVQNDFSVSDPDAAGITIKSSNVILLLGDHTITGPGNKAGTGILLDNVKHVLVAYGKLQNFGTGVMLVNSSKSSVGFIKVEGGDEFADPPAGIPPQIGILLLNSYKNLVLKNKLELVNLGIFVRGGMSSNNYITRNRVVGGEKNGLLAICYNPAEGQGNAGPSKDKVTNNFLNRFNTGIQTSVGSEKNRFTNNTIHYFMAAYNDFNGSNIFKNNKTMQILP